MDPEVAEAVIAERTALIDDLAGLSPDQWARPTTCGDWDVHDVLAHLVDTAKTTRLGFVWQMLTALGDFDKINARGVAREKGADPAATLAAFREVADRRTGPPAAAETRLVEAYVHGEDIRHAVGLAGDYPPAMVGRALDYQVNAGKHVGGSREFASGVTLMVTDLGTSLGQGPEVHGSALDLLLTVTGRPFGRDGLTGPGVDLLLG